MARPRTPTSLLEARGAYVRNPQRRAERANEPVPQAGLGAAPEYFNGGQRICWDELLTMAPPGVLTSADRGLVETAALLWAELRIPTVEVVTKDGAVIEIRKVIKGSEVSAFVACLAKMACTPVDRSKVSVPAPKRAASGFDALQ